MTQTRRHGTMRLLVRGGCIPLLRADGYDVPADNCVTDPAIYDLCCRYSSLVISRNHCVMCKVSAALWIIYGVYLDCMTFRITIIGANANDHHVVGGQCIWYLGLADSPRVHAEPWGNR